MRYLRMLSNSIVAGALASAYVVALVLQLNPTLSLHPLRLLPLAQSVGLFYLVHLSVIAYVVLVVRQLLARELFSPAWVSVGVLAGLGSLAALAGAAMMWANLLTFSLMLDPATTRHLADSALVLVAAALLLAAVALGRRHLWPQARGVWACVVTSIGAASIAAPLAIRGPATAALVDTRSIDAPREFTLPDRPSRVVVIAVDAGSLDFVTSATAEGRLPNFGRILDAGAVMHMTTVRPTSTDAVWAAVATGKLPQKNGVRSAGIYRVAPAGTPIDLLPDYCFAHEMVRFGFLVEQPHTAATLRTRPLWSILDGYGIPIGVVNWPLTDPAPALAGYVVSDTFHAAAATPTGVEEMTAVYPRDLYQPALHALEAPAGEAAVPLARSAVDARFEAPARVDRAYDRIAQVLAQARPTRVRLVRYQSLDPIGHYFLRYTLPSEFGDITDEERRRFGLVLERHYALVDDAIGRAIGALEADDLLLVVSGFGMEPLGLGKRLLERVIGDPDVSGTHDTAPEGFLLAYGASVARGRSARLASVVDIAPTVLYFLGLPIGRDMDGYARTELFHRAFTEERPITFIPTYDR